MAKKISDRQYARALYDATIGLPESDWPQAASNFLAVLHKQGKLKRVEKIIGEFSAYAKAKQGIADITIESARKLDKKMVEELKNVFGKKTEAEEKISEDLLGGVKIRVGDIIYDASLKKQLSRLKQAIS